MTQLNINDTLPFGKFKGMNIKAMIEAFDVTEQYISYLNWAIKTWTNISFSDEVRAHVKLRIDKLHQTQSKNKPRQQNLSYIDDRTFAHKMGIPEYF